MTQRRDARLNRARLVAAAEEVFETHGSAVSLDLVAEHAGVGRATLYRHFPDRPALVAAVFDARVDALERRVAGMPGADALHLLVHAVGARQASSPGLLTTLRRSPEGVAHLAGVTARVRALLARALAEAHAAGAARPDATTADVMLVFAMLEGVVALRAPEEAAAAVERAADLALRGLLLTPVPARR